MKKAKPTLITYTEDWQNPEKLNIWSTEGKVHIRTEILPVTATKKLPACEFKNLMSAWLDAYHKSENISAHKITLRKVKQALYVRWRLKYKSWQVDLYESTLFHLANMVAWDPK